MACLTFGAQLRKTLEGLMSQKARGLERRRPGFTDRQATSRSSDAEEK